MSFSVFLESRRDRAKALVRQLHTEFPYVSILGTDNKAKSVRVDSNTSSIAPGRDTQCGFVVKLWKDSSFFEYSVDDLPENIHGFAREISSRYARSLRLNARRIRTECPADPPLVQSFCRPSDLDQYPDRQLLEYCTDLQKQLNSGSPNIQNSIIAISSLEVSTLFVSPNRELDQNYTWINGFAFLVYRENDKTVQVREGENAHKMETVLAGLPGKAQLLPTKAQKLVNAKPIVPGVYDVITDPTITGLIAHEAFGHGVEMDQFVKDRALAKDFLGKYVASPITNMHDGAAAVVSSASYFFDDDGVLAQDAQIIKDGILVAGISDLTAATELGTSPTGNGRRETTRRKAYTRMTNTFIEPGKDRLEDMIASISHGYMIFETNNGMEDPKNWAIQCVAEYGVEIVDGKLTDNIVAPVVMSGYVPDLLKSISMISSDFVITGAGMCGKGYKEWVRVSDGGPALKVKVKLG